MSKNLILWLQALGRILQLQAVVALFVMNITHRICGTLRLKMCAVEPLL